MYILTSQSVLLIQTSTKCTVKCGSRWIIKYGGKQKTKCHDLYKHTYLSIGKQEDGWVGKGYIIIEPVKAKGF